MRPRRFPTVVIVLAGLMPVVGGRGRTARTDRWKIGSRTS